MLYQETCAHFRYFLGIQNRFFNVLQVRNAPEKEHALEKKNAFHSLLLSFACPPIRSPKFMSVWFSASEE